MCDSKCPPMANTPYTGVFGPVSGTQNLTVYWRAWALDCEGEQSVRSETRWFVRKAGMPDGLPAQLAVQVRARVASAPAPVVEALYIRFETGTSIGLTAAPGLAFFPDVSAKLLQPGEGLSVEGYSAGVYFEPVQLADGQLTERTVQLELPSLVVAARNDFRALDADRSGGLTLGESGVWPDEFSRADGNESGDLSMEELLLATVGTPGAVPEVYADPAGSPIERGEENAPFDSVFEAVNFVADGGTVWLHADSLFLEAIRIDRPMTLRNSGAGSVVIGFPPDRPGLSPAFR